MDEGVSVSKELVRDETLSNNADADASNWLYVMDEQKSHREDFACCDALVRGVAAQISPTLPSPLPTIMDHVVSCTNAHDKARWLGLLWELLDGYLGFARTEESFMRYVRVIPVVTRPLYELFWPWASMYETCPSRVIGTLLRLSLQVFTALHRLDWPEFFEDNMSEISELVGKLLGIPRHPPLWAPEVHMACDESFRLSTLSFLVLRQRGVFHLPPELLDRVLSFTIADFETDLVQLACIQFYHRVAGFALEDGFQLPKPLVENLSRLAVAADLVLYPSLYKATNNLHGLLGVKLESPRAVVEFVDGIDTTTLHVPVQNRFTRQFA